jgi:hypothetical protein
MNTIRSIECINMRVLLKIYRIYFEKEQNVQIIMSYLVRNIHRLVRQDRGSGVHEHGIKSTVEKYRKGAVNTVTIVVVKIIQTEDTIIGA